MRPWVLVLVGSLFLGSALGASAPASWTFRWTDGVLLGSAIYVAGLRRYVERREGEARLAGVGSASLVAGMLPGLLRQLIGDVYNVRRRKHFPHPCTPQLAGDGLSRQ